MIREGKYVPVGRVSTRYYAGAALLPLVLWFMLALPGIWLRPDGPPNLIHGLSYRVITDGTVSPDFIRMFKNSVHLYFPAYRDDPAGFPITLRQMIPMKKARYSGSTPDGGCAIWLDPNNAEFSLETPAHEFNHCRRHDPWAGPPGIYYAYVEIFPMKLELGWRRLVHSNH